MLLHDSQYDCYNHLIFDNSLMDGGYVYSYAAAIAPSRLDTIDHKIPVTADHFRSPPNSLRLSWLSQTGGDWLAELWAERWLGKDRCLSGDTLSFGCCSEEDIPAHRLPSIGVTIKDGPRTLPMQLIGIAPDLPAGQWCQIRIPFSAFPKATVEYDFSRIEKVVFTQSIDDGEPHTLYIDEVKVLDASSNGVTRRPGALTAVAYDHHVDLSWPDAVDPAAAYYQVGS